MKQTKYYGLPSAADLDAVEAEREVRDRTLRSQAISEAPSASKPVAYPIPSCAAILSESEFQRLLERCFRNSKAYTGSLDEELRNQTFLDGEK
jgi:hypothetical protein